MSIVCVNPVEVKSTGVFAETFVSVNVDSWLFAINKLMN